MNYKRELFSQLQQDVLRLTETDLTFLLIPENTIQIECVPIPELTVHVNADL